MQILASNVKINQDIATILEYKNIFYVKIYSPIVEYPRSTILIPSKILTHKPHLAHIHCKKRITMGIFV